MNILISAYSINPYKGSEDGIGWNWVLQHEKNYKKGDRIIVITKKFNEKDTRRGFKEFGIKNVELIVVDVPNYLNWFREKYSIFHHMYYILWQHWAYTYIKKLGIKFDIIHHVTMNDYRIPSEMYKYTKAKVIWGPVGGAQVTPKSLKAYEKSKLISGFREVVNKSCSWNPMYKKKLSSYDKIYCINRETQRQIESVIGKKVELLPELAIRDEYKNIILSEKFNKVFNIVFVGRLIGKKGITFLVDTLALMPDNIEWNLLIFGEGDDRRLIEEHIEKSGIRNRIKLMGNRSLNEISEAYQKADIFVLPSLRETSGNVLLEAMAYGIPIVAFDTSFCSQLKLKECGIFIDTEQPLEKVKSDFRDAIVDLEGNKELRRQMAMNGYNFVNKELTWEDKYRRIYSEYRS